MRRWINSSLYLYIIFDVALTNLSFGYYAPGWKFDSDLFFKTVTFSQQYHFTTSPYEFQILMFIRQVFSAIAVLLIILGKKETTKHLFLVVMFNAVFTYSFSLVKFLAFSENSEQLYYPGVWFSVVWAILSGFIQSAIWYFVLSSHPFDYHQLMNNSSNNDEVTNAETVHDNTADFISTDNVENGQSTDEAQRQSLTKVLARLFSYCGHLWPWFVSGFVFLNVYALARVFIPSYVAQVIADVVNQRGLNALFHSILVLGALTATSSFFGGLRGGCFDYATALVTLRIRLDLFTSLINQDIFFSTLPKLEKQCLV
uniref:ABC transmembrane type-1 domain-containing protein n=1 Tax=Caenorhabditis tropicalis TaxID=1561998 RepID=A0A1I7T769_9PELO